LKTIRCGRGLGDSLYLQGVVRHLLSKGQQLTAVSDYPEIFSQLGIKVIPFTRERINIIAHYSMRRGYQETSQFKDCLLQAGITEKAEFRLDWQVQNKKLVHSLKRYRKPIVLVQMVRPPMARTDGFGMSVLPKMDVIQSIIDKLHDTCLIVQIGAGKQLHTFNNIDVDLSDKTSIKDLLDIASQCDAMLGYPSYMIPLAESFDKPALFVWSHKALASGDQVIRTMTPKKLLYKDNRYVIDNWNSDKITEIADDFLRQISSKKSD
jgi:hypothetical protein